MQLTIDQLNQDFSHGEDPISIGGIILAANGGDSLWKFGECVATRSRSTIDGTLYVWSSKIDQWHCTPPRESLPETVIQLPPVTGGVRVHSSAVFQRPCIQEFHHTYPTLDYDKYFADLEQHGHKYGPGWSNPNWTPPGQKANEGDLTINDAAFVPTSDGQPAKSEIALADAPAESSSDKPQTKSKGNK